VALLAGLSLVAVATAAIRHWSTQPIQAVGLTPTQTISTATVILAPLDRTLVVTGSLAAWDELPVGSEAGGLAITAVEVEQGDRVVKGQLLARLDDSVLKAQADQADASIAQAEAALRKAEAMATTAASDVRRAKELMKNGYISGQLAEQRQTALATAQADVNVARQTLETNKALKAERFARLKQAEIRAPSDGIVSKRSATLGNVVAVGQELFRLIRDGRVELRAEVPELDFPRLKEGLPVAITLDGAEGRRFEGRIRLIGATVDPQTRLGLVYIALPDDPVLKPGMFVHGAVATESGQALQVPEEALVYKDGRPAIFVIDAANRAHLSLAETGARHAGMVEIRKGATAGDRVALSGAGYLKDNDLVRIEDAAAPAHGSGAGPTGAARDAVEAVR